MRKGSSFAKNVFIDEKNINSYGSLRLRYKTTPMTKEYRRSICNLPKTYKKWKTSGNSRDSKKYMKFFDTWGTVSTSTIVLLLLIMVPL